MKQIKKIKNVFVSFMVLALVVTGINVSGVKASAGTTPFTGSVSIKASGAESVGASVLLDLPTVSEDSSDFYLEDEILTVTSSDTAYTGIEDPYLTYTEITSGKSVSFETKLRFTVKKDAEARTFSLYVNRTNLKTGANIVIATVNVTIAAPDYGTVAGSFKVGSTSLLLNQNVSKAVTYSISKTDTATGYYPITATGFDTSVVSGVTIDEKNITITTAATAPKGASTSVTLTSGSEKKVIKVTIKNATTKVTAKKKTVKVKKGKTAKLTFVVKGGNNKYKVSDTVSVKSSVAKKVKIKKKSLSKTKYVVKVKAVKKGKSVITVTAGGKSAKTTVKVK
ncbi:MAG: hypothetical protein K6D02_03545 [Lachnospiraceae bacterium]|nr:hypothetical protein [Lachnospiraceae bacterium]